MLANLAIKPVLIGSGLIILALGIGLGAQTLRLKSAHADVKAAQADVKEVKVQLGQWRQSSIDRAKAAAGWKAIAGRRLTLLEECQAEGRRVADENEAAIGRLQATKRDTDRAFAAFVAQTAARNRLPACAAARAELDRACPVVPY